MKQGNQFYLELQLTDDNDKLLEINKVKKIQFNINNLTKIYDNVSNDVTYDEITGMFKVWLTEKETFDFSIVNIDARILFDNDIILGSEIQTMKFLDVVKKEYLDNETESVES